MVTSLKFSMCKQNHRLKTTFCGSHQFSSSTATQLKLQQLHISFTGLLSVKRERITINIIDVMAYILHTFCSTDSFGCYKGFCNNRLSKTILQQVKQPFMKATQTKSIYSNLQQSTVKCLPGLLRKLREILASKEASLRFRFLLDRPFLQQNVSLINKNDS